jgi:hypothetical protein
MDNKNSITQANDFKNHITEQDLPAELLELSEEVLSQVRGGVTYDYWKPEPPVPCCTVYPPDWNPNYPFTSVVAHPASCFP